MRNKVGSSYKLFFKVLNSSDLFTGKTREVMRIALELSKSSGSSFIGAEQLLRAIFLENTSAASMALRLTELGENLLSVPRGDNLVSSERTLCRLLELSWVEAEKLGHDYIGPEHLLLALSTDHGGRMHLKEVGIDFVRLRTTMLRLLRESVN